MKEQKDCTYDEGIVAFVDILGFSEYIKKEEHTPNKVSNIFEFMKKIIYLYSDGKIGGVKIAFFSDSCILTTNNLSISGFETIMMTHYIINSAIYQNIGLLTRGAVSLGKYYNKDNIAFGSGIIDAYEQEKYSKHTRTIISHSLIEKFGDEIIKTSVVEKDVDGFYYYNFYLLEMADAVKDGNIDVTKAKEILLKGKDQIDFLIKKYLYTLCTDKYIWLITPFNKACLCMEKEFKGQGFEKLVINIEDYQF